MTVAEDIVQDDIDIDEALRNFSLSVPIEIPTAKLSPDFVYRWIDRSSPNAYQRRLGIGWRPLTKADFENLIVKGVKPDSVRVGTHINEEGYVALSNDLILAKMPKRIHTALKQRIQKLNYDKRRAAKAQFHEAGKLAGVKTYEGEEARGGV